MLRADPAITDCLPAAPRGDAVRLTLVDGLSLGALLDGLEFESLTPIATLLNGEPVAAERRHRVRLAHGDLITLLPAETDG